MTQDDVLVWKDEYEWVPLLGHMILITIFVTAVGLVVWLTGPRWAALAIWMFWAVAMVPATLHWIQLFREGAR